MSAPNIGGRNRYQAGGGTNWVPFIPLAGLVVFVSAALAVLLCLIFKWGFYFVVLMPVLAGLGVAVLVRRSVNKGHCRNPWVGALLGLVAGLILYVGYYYASMVRDFGWDVAGQFRLFPEYVHLRLKTDVIRHEGEPEPDNNDSGPHPERIYFNSAISTFELGFVLVLTVGAGLTAARRVYCENCRTWSKRETTTFLPEVGAGITEALRLGSVQSLAALFTSPPKPRAPHAAVAVDYCPNLLDGQTPVCAAYISVKHVKLVPPASLGKDPFDQSKGKLLARNVLLGREEIRGLLPRFPSLEKAAGVTAAEALKELRVEVPEAPPQMLAEIKPVEALFAGKVLTTRNKLIGAALMFALLGIAVVSMTVLFAGAITAFPDHPPEGGVAPGRKLFGEIIMGLGIVMAIPSLFFALSRLDFFTARFFRRAVLREFSRRPDPWVNPSDPEAVLVQIIPRENWGKLKLNDASDIGLVRVDAQRNELLFEGDRERYRIPGAALSACDVEIFIAGQGTHGATKLFRVVLQAGRDTGFWEAPLAQIGGGGLFRTKKRERWANELRGTIRAIMPAAQ